MSSVPISGFNFTPNPGTTNASLQMVGSIILPPSIALYNYSFTISPAGFNITPPSGSFASIDSFNLASLGVIGSSSTTGIYNITLNLSTVAGPVIFTPAGGNQVTVTINAPPSPPCFKEDTNILTFNPDLEKEEYLSVQSILPGSLVKTLKHGYLKVEMIGKSQIYNSGDEERCKHRLYKCTTDVYPELTEDLVITGCHSILVDWLTQEQGSQIMKEYGLIFETDGKPRLMAYLDEKAQPFEEEGNFTIYHLALENENYIGNYGIYANGLLVESCSKRYLKELSNMEIVE